jgi:hypothetical protein
MLRLRLPCCGESDAGRRKIAAMEDAVGRSVYGCVRVVCTVISNRREGCVCRPDTGKQSRKYWGGAGPDAADQGN